MTTTEEKSFGSASPREPLADVTFDVGESVHDGGDALTPSAGGAGGGRKGPGGAGGGMGAEHNAPGRA